MSLANDLEQQMLNLINQERENANLDPLTFNGDLNEASEDHSTWMLDTDTFSHTGQGGSSAGDRIVAAGYQLEGNWTWGENIGWQSERGDPGLEDDVADIHESLMNSPGHRANILNPNFEEIGIGIERGDFGRFDSVMVTQNFGSTDAVSDDTDDGPVEDDTPVADNPMDDMPEDEEPPVAEDPTEEEPPVADAPEDDEPEEEETPVADGPDDDLPEDDDVPVEDEPLDEPPVADGPEMEDPDEDDPVADGPEDDDPDAEEPPVADGPDMDPPAEDEPPVADGPDPDMPVDEEPPVADGPDDDMPDDPEPPVADGPDPEDFDIEELLADLSDLLEDLFDAFEFIASEDCDPDDMVTDMPMDDDVVDDDALSEDDIEVSCDDWPADDFEFEVSVNLTFNFDLG